MKLLFNTFLCLVFSSSLVLAQTSKTINKDKSERKKETLSLSKYENLKSQGKLSRDIDYTVTYPEKPIDLSSARTLPPATTFSSASGVLVSPPCSYVPTDDFLTPFGGDVFFDDSPPNGPFEVQIPFEFCFYGETYTSFFINNNGNITFENSFNTFTAQSFPAAGIPPMIAPFWGDVDTGSDINPLGQVRYNVYSDYAIVSWDTVAVFPENGALRNTFQVIISDGVSTVCPPGNNIIFIYGDMQWTTGTASGGAGGFGGTPATVGVNRGDGADYIQLGLFDAPGTNYDGPFGTVDQVSFLDDNVFFFNTCLQPGAENNIAPLSIGAPICDTITVCVGSTFDLDFNFIPVEPDQTVDAVLQTTGISGLVIDAITPGTQCNVVGSFTGTVDNIGYNTVLFEATDNGTPAANYIMALTFQVIESGFVPEILGVTSICAGEPTTLSVGGGQYDEYGWSPNGEASPTIEVTEPGEYQVTVIIDGCLGTSDPITVTEQEVPVPVITGDDGVCGDNLAQIYTTEEFNSYQWSNFNNTDTASVGPGTYIVTVTNEFGCAGTSEPFTVDAFATIVPVINGNDHVCFEQLNVLSTEDSYATYLWSTSATDSTVEVGAGTYTVFVEDEFGCNGTSEPFTIAQSTPLAEVNDIIPFCLGDTIIISGAGNYASYEWLDVNNETIGTEQTLAWTGDTLTLVVTDEFGCISSVEFEIPATALPVAAFSANPATPVVLLPDALIQYNDVSSSTEGDPVNFWYYLIEPADGSWTENDDTFESIEQNPLIQYPDTGLYFITQTVISELGCVDTVKTSLYVIDNPFVPNVFSPNGDGFNDFLKIPFLNGYPSNEVLIFNRWGKKVYESKDYNNDWDGENLPSGTYFYVVSAPTLSQTLKGSITLIRD